MSIRKDIPESIKRKVRQKYHFGCIFCGCPIYEYDHIDDYSKTKNDSLDNLILLCPTHHTEKTNKLIPKQKIIEQINSYIKRDRTDRKELFFNNKFKLILGNNIIEQAENHLYNIMDKDFFSICTINNDFLINAKFHDKEGNTALIIENSEYSFSTNIWDIQYEGQNIIFRNKLYDIFLNISLDYENQRIVLYGKFYIDKNNFIKIDSKGIFLNRILLISNCITTNATEIGLCITDSLKPWKKIAFYNCLNCSNSRQEGWQVGFFWKYDFLMKNVVN